MFLLRKKMLCYKSNTQIVNENVSPGLPLLQ